MRGSGSEARDAFEFDLQGGGVELCERQLEECAAAGFDGGQRGVECGIDLRFANVDLGGVFEAPMGLECGAEVHGAGFPGGFVTGGDDYVRRAVGESLVAFAVQSCGGDAGRLQGAQATGQNRPLGKLPALTAVKPVGARWLNRASDRMLRQLLAVHMNRTFIDFSVMWA